MAALSKVLTAMLANNNRAIIARLAKNQRHANRRGVAILFITITLATLLVFSVFTTGISYLQLGRLQDARLYGADYDIAVVNGFSSAQRQSLLENDLVKSVGTGCYSGVVQSTEADETVSVGLIWYDETLWNDQRAQVITDQQGHYSEAANEVMVSREALAQCGLNELGLGDTFQATVETNAGVVTMDFVISGIWEGYGDTSPIFVSRAFFDRSGFSLNDSGFLFIKLAQNYVLPAAIQDLRAGLSLNDTQSFQAHAYIENSWKVLLGIIGLSIIVCLSAALLVYNIFYLSAAEKTRYYGLLQTLGMTQRQLRQLLLRQMLGVVLLAMLSGLLIGVVMALSVVPHLLQAMRLTESLISTHFQPMVFLLTVVCVGGAVALGMRAPLRRAVRVTPLEAVRGVQPDTVLFQGRRHRHLLWGMAVDQLCRDRRKTLVVLASLSISLTVFLCLTTIVSSQGERNVMPLYWDADMIVRNDSETSEDDQSYQALLNEATVNDIAAIDGVEAVYVVRGMPMTVTDDAFMAQWLKNYSSSRPYLDYDEVMAAYRSDPSRYYGMIKAISEEEFDYINQQLTEPVDKERFLEGECCLVSVVGSQLPENVIDGAPVSFAVNGEPHQLTIAAESGDGYLSSSRNIGPCFIVSEHYLQSLTTTPLILGFSVHYEEPYDAVVEQQVLTALQKLPDLQDVFYESRLQEREAIRASEGDLNEAGAAIALLLLVVGLLNYINTMAASVQHRRLSFAVMESLGMTPAQLRGLLVREGFLVAVGSIFLTVTFGLALTAIVFQAVNHMGVPFSVPLLPMLAACLLVVVLCVNVPLVVFQHCADDGALMERLRMSE